MQTARRVASLSFTDEFAGVSVMVVLLCLQEPKVRQGNTLRHPPEIGPAAPETLQWPSTASSGRRLTRTTWGGW